MGRGILFVRQAVLIKKVCRKIKTMNENHAAIIWLAFGLFAIAGMVALYLTPLARAFAG